MADTNRVAQFIAATVNDYVAREDDVTTKFHALFEILKKKGRFKTNGKGTRFEWPVKITDFSAPSRPNQGVQNRVFPIEKALTRAYLDYVKLEKPDAITKDDIENNKGDAVQLVDLAETHATSMLDSMKQQVATDIFSDGSTTNQASGIRAFCPSANTTGTYAAISRADYTYWRNQVVDISSNIGTGDWAVNAPYALMKAELEASIGAGTKNECPDLFVINKDWYSELQNIIWGKFQVRTEDDPFSIGRKMLYVTVGSQIPIMWDANCPDDYGFGLNLDKISVRIVPSIEGSKKDLFGHEYDYDIQSGCYLDVLTLKWQIVCESPRHQVVIVP